MYSDHDTPKGWVAPFGHPWIKACSRLPMAFRSVPRPSSPPGAKASTECPYHARSVFGSLRKPPCTETIHRIGTLQIFLPTYFSTQQVVHPLDHGQITFNTPLNTRNPTMGVHLERQKHPVRHTVGLRDLHASLSLHEHRTRPETHQNLIYPDKEQQHIAPSDRNRGRS